MSDLLSLSTSRVALPHRLASVSRSAPGDASLVASAATNPDFLQSVLDVSASPVYVPAKRIEADLANKKFPYAKAAVRYSPTEWADLLEFIAKLGTVHFEATTSRENSLYLEVENGKTSNATVAIEREDRYDVIWTVTVAAADRKVADRTMDSILTFIGEYPPPPPPPELPHNIVPVDFWMQNPATGGGYSRRRYIEVADFADIENNYPAKLREQLRDLMAIDDPSGGKLILLQGPPGTGKTRLILSAISEWREWCGASVVTDSDKLLDDATYLNSIVFDSEGQGWLLLIIEDGDEFLNVDSKDSKGQAIARLLNLSDGIVGQGIKLLTILSTNVEVKQLNPAVIRPGRCLASLHFGEFEADEANAWLAANGVEATVEQSVTLAQMYAMKSGTDASEFIGESEDMETVVAAEEA